MSDKEQKEEYTFKTTLIFWKIYELNFNFTLPVLREYLEKEGSLKLYEKYRFKFGDNIQQPLKWISRQANLYSPICFKIDFDRFESKIDSNMTGNIRIEGHIHYGEVLVIHCEFLFDNYHKIEEFIEISEPSNVILQDSKQSLTDKFNEIRKNIRDILIKSELFTETSQNAVSLEPWHHTWIIWDAKPDFNRNDYRFMGKKIGKNAKYSIGLTFRTEKWRELDPISYRDQINLKNLSPYKDEFIMITHAGNVIIPGFGLLDPDAMKNLLIDTIYAPEIANVQRFLTLMHLEHLIDLSNQLKVLIPDESLEVETKQQIIKRIFNLEHIQSELNRIVLKLDKDLIILKISRLLFTSTFKTSMFNEMIDKLDGFMFSKNIAEIIERLRLSIEREREKLKLILLKLKNITEEEVSISREIKICIVCKGKAIGFNVFICPSCETIYCKKCAIALIEMENVCWVCGNAIDESRPTKPFLINIEDLNERGPK